MAELLLTIPALFGDHHTMAVHAILDQLEGVESAFVTSAFHQVAVKFDPKKTDEEKIKETLANTGYQEGELENFYPESESSGGVKTRHSASIAETHSFTDQAPSWQGRPLWPCPGIEYKAQMED
jgi:copper chaperone CopZ